MAKNWNRALRPRDWESVVGQRHLVDMFQKMILEDSFPAFSIFFGPSGVGKSCIAELVAKSLKCTGDILPCNKCANCIAANNFQSPDIIKCDMPNMTDSDVTDLITNIFHRESAGVKVYIIEEAHTMDRSGKHTQNKWLEQLTRIPDNVYIIFCTTQYYSLIPEIRGRANSYQFENPSDNECLALIERLSEQFEFQLPEMDIQLYFIRSNRNSPRGIISSLETVVASTLVNEEQIRKYSRLPEPDLFAKVFVGLLDKTVDVYEFVRILHSDDNINCAHIMRGLQEFVLSVILEISLQLDQGFSEKTSNEIRKVLKTEGEAALSKITMHLGTLSEAQQNDKRDALLSLITLKLKLSGVTTRQIVTEIQSKASEANVLSQRKANLQSIQQSSAALTSEFVTDGEHLRSLLK